jgi:hypothetical protein
MKQGSAGSPMADNEKGRSIQPYPRERIPIERSLDQIQKRVVGARNRNYRGSADLARGDVPTVLAQKPQPRAKKQFEMQYESGIKLMPSTAGKSNPRSVTGKQGGSLQQAANGGLAIGSG